MALAILSGALFTVVVAYSLGALLLETAERDIGLRFLSGAPVLSFAVFCLCATGLARPWIFAALGASAIALAWRRAAPGDWKFVRMHRAVLIAFAVFFILYFFNSMAPEISYDGSRYHLGLVGRYLREHGFHAITDNMYASLSQGVEMLFLFAFAFGKHSAAAMVHFSFLLALAWLMFRYATRSGFPLAGACAALLVFASPAVGVDASSAYNDVAVAAIAFALFCLLQVWDRDRSPRLLIAIGLVAGFAYAAKYTAYLAVPYAVAFVAWKSRRIRDVAVVAFFVAVMILPWMVKNWLWIHNPVAPFFDGLFPNPYFTVSFERDYWRQMASYSLKSRSQIPMQVTTYGSLSGLLGPVFLLSPLALLSLKRREGQQLLLGALIFGANYFSNIGARFLIPPLPFVALALALVLSRIPQLALAVALLHAVISWPAIVRHYCAADAWHLVKVPWREALRIKPEDGFLASNLPDYRVARMVDEHTAPGSTVFTFTPIPEAYTSRKMLVSFESSTNAATRAVFFTGFVPDYAPTWRLRFHFPRQPLRAIRIVQTNHAPETWSIHEVRIFDSERELPSDPYWKWTAHPYPWGIDQVHDGRPVTFWSCGDTLQPGEFVQADFGGSIAADSALLEAAPNQFGIRLQLEGEDESGTWRQLSPAPETYSEPAPAGLRRAAAEELKRRGIDYLLMFNGEFGADDLAHNAASWGVVQVGEFGAARLYRLP